MQIEGSNWSSDSKYNSDNLPSRHFWRLTVSIPTLTSWHLKFLLASFQGRSWYIILSKVCWRWIYLMWGHWNQPRLAIFVDIQVDHDFIERHLDESIRLLANLGTLPKNWKWLVSGWKPMDLEKFLEPYIKHFTAINTNCPGNVDCSI